MGTKLKKTLLHYKAPYILFSGIMLYVICSIKKPTLYSGLSNLAVLLIWAFGSTLTVMSVRYRDLTGRVFLTDRLEYSLSFRDLVHFFQDADPYQMDLASLPIEDWKDAEGIILGKVGDRLVKRSSKGVGNLALFSLPGGGKTTSQIIPSALRFKGSVLAIDIKGDILAQAEKKRKIKVFDPEHPNSSVHYDPMQDISSMLPFERKTALEQIANVLLPDTNEKDGKYFIEGGRDFFCGVSLYLLEQDSDTSLPEIARQIVTGNPFKWAMEISKSSSDLAKSYTSSYIGSNEKNVAGAYGCIVKAVRPFAFGNLAELLDGRGNCVSPKTLEDGFDIYIEIPQEKIKLLAPVTTLMVQQFLTYFMTRPDSSRGESSTPILFLLDEFPQLDFDFDVLSAALSTLRSKGVSLFMAMQSISQLTQKYEESGFRSIIDTCAYISIMSAQDPESREFFSKLCGTKKVLNMGSSTGNKSSSKSHQEAREPVFQPADFGNLGDDVIIVANGKYIRAEKTYFFK